MAQPIVPMESWEEVKDGNQFQLTAPLALKIERFHSRGQHLYKFIGTKESVYKRKEFNPHEICLQNQHGHRFIFLEHQYDRCDVK